MSVQIPALSTQYVQVPVRATSGGLSYNPTADTVQMAFLAGWAPPGSGDWKTASWAGTIAVNGIYSAECLIGPQNGGVSLAVGSYTAWLKITDNPQVPVFITGTLTIIP
jgi:hypothetical protein